MVVKAVKAEFAETVSPQQVEAYNPERRAGQGLSEQYRELFRVTREQFLENAAAIGISHRVTRLRALQRLARAGRDAGQHRAGGPAARPGREGGRGRFSPTSGENELTGKDGAPLVDGGITVAFVRAAPVDAG